MNIKNYYEVTFDTKKGGDRSYKYYVYANTKTEAETLFWNHEIIQEKIKKMHLFHVKMRKVKDNEIMDYRCITLV